VKHMAGGASTGRGGGGDKRERTERGGGGRVGKDQAGGASTGREGSGGGSSTGALCTGFTLVGSNDYNLDNIRVLV
jgi:hypothetical protein